MSDIQANQLSAENLEDTVWVQEVSFIDSIPRWIAMTFVFVVFIGIWQLVTSFGLVSPIILPTPMETFKDMIFVGQNLVTGGYMLTALWITILDGDLWLRVGHPYRVYAWRDRRRNGLW